MHARTHAHVRTHAHTPAHPPARPPARPLARTHTRTSTWTCAQRAAAGPATDQTRIILGPEVGEFSCVVLVAANWTATAGEQCEASGVAEDPMHIILASSIGVLIDLCMDVFVLFCVPDAQRPVVPNRDPMLP